MDLWIRSQDKTRLIKINSLEYVEYQGVHSINGYYTNEVDNYDLGIYETKERALEVLDELQKIIKWCQKNMKDVTIGDMKNLKGCFEDYVYEMPKE